MSRNSEPHLIADKAYAAILCSRTTPKELIAPPASGIYAIFLRRPGPIATFFSRDDGLIYIGLSKNLSDRQFQQHFSSGNTGFSTLRRSVGAILKTPLGLRAIPRATGSSESSVRSYRFVNDGEDRLTDWMYTNLHVAVFASRQFLDIENALIKSMEPLLNLAKWTNPNRCEIKRLRKVCADEARCARQDMEHNLS